MIHPRHVLTDFAAYSEYFLRLKAREGGRLLPFRLNTAQRKVELAVQQMREEKRPVRLQIDKARRLGMSTWVAGKFSHRIFTRRYQRGTVIAHKGDSARDIFQIYERMWENLPPVWMGLPIQPHRKGAKGKLLQLPGLDNELAVGSAESEGFGRGGDSQMVHLSEVAYFENPEDFLRGLLPQVPATGDSIVVLESTANGPKDFWYELWQKSQDGTSGYLPLFFGWMEEPAHRLETELPRDLWDEEEVDLSERFGCDGFQLAWRRFKLETECFGRIDRLRAEYPATAEESFTAVGDPAWDDHVITGCYRRQEPLWRGEIMRNGVVKNGEGRLIVWEEPVEKAEYVIGVDVAGGVHQDSGDLSVASVFRTGRKPGQWPIQVAEWAGRIETVTFAEILTLLGFYYKRALLAVEVTGIGRPVQSALQKTYFYPNLHRWVAWDRNNSRSTTFGWETTWKSKEIMMGLTDWILRCRKVQLRSPWLVEELLAFQQVGPDDYEGVKGDDRIFAFMIAMCSWFQHQYAGVPLKELRVTLAKLYGSPTAAETAVAPPAWSPEDGVLADGGSKTRSDGWQPRKSRISELGGDGDW